jgi:hypothetical protein
MLGFCIPVILFLAGYYLMDLQRVSYTYVQYVYIYNVQECINIYIKIIIKIVFFSAVAEISLPVQLTYAPGLQNMRSPLLCVYDLCPWPVPSPCPPPVYDPYPWPMPLTVFFLYTKNNMLIFGSGSLHFFILIQSSFS